MFHSTVTKGHWRAFDFALLTVMGTCLGFLAGVAFTAGALTQPAPPLRCALSLAAR